MVIVVVDDKSLLRRQGRHAGKHLPLVVFRHMHVFHAAAVDGGVAGVLRVDGGNRALAIRVRDGLQRVLAAVHGVIHRLSDEIARGHGDDVARVGMGDAVVGKARLPDAAGDLAVAPVVVRQFAQPGSLGQMLRQHTAQHGRRGHAGLVQIALGACNHVVTSCLVDVRARRCDSAPDFRLQRIA